MLDAIGFVVFLVEYVAYVIGSYFLVLKLGFSRIGTPRIRELLTLLFVVQIAVVLLLLGHTWNPALIVFVLATYQVPLVAEALLGRQMSKDSNAEILLWSIQRGAKGQGVTPNYGVRGVLVGWVVILLVFVVSVVAFFVNDRPSPELTTWLLAAQALGYATYLLNSTGAAMSALASPALSDRTRLLQLIARLTAIAPLTLWLAILSSAFGWLKPTASVSVGSLDIGLSPLVAIAVVAFLAATSLLPYAIGVQRRGRVRSEMLTADQEWLGRLIGILAVPERATFVEQLEAFQSDAEGTSLALLEAHPEVVLEPSIEIDADEFTEAVSSSTLVPVTAEEGSSGLALFRELLPRIEQRDPVFRFARRLEEMRAAAGEVVGRITGNRNKTIGRSLARSWAESLQRREGANDTELKSLSGRSWAGAAAGFAVTALSGVLIDQVGRWAWQTFIGVPAS